MKAVVSLAALVVCGAALAVWADTTSTSTQDPVKISPDIYTVLLNNEYTRVVEVHLKPGQKSPMHSHPAYIIYNFGPGKVRFTGPDGKTTEMELKPGQTVWRDAESHEVENIGTTECHVLNIELKGMKNVGERVARLAKWREGGVEEHVMMAPGDLKWQAGPPVLPPGLQVVMLEGDLKSAGPYTLQAKMPAGYKVPPHFHPADEHVTVLSGALEMDMGDQLDQSKGKELPAGGYSMMPAGMHHWALAKQDTVIQIHGIGPWGITYVNPADDPQKANLNK